MTWIIVGLGNPGEEYEGTRHNTGRMVLAYFAKKYDCTPWQENKKMRATISRGSLGKQTLLLLAPDTFMNKSGAAVAKYVKSVRAAQQLVVVYDDLDLPLGKIKVSFDRGSGGHKGLESIIRTVKTTKFVRVRIGISPSTPGGKIKKPRGEQAVNDFILKEFSAQGGSGSALGGKSSEVQTFRNAVKQASEAIETIITRGIAAAMNESN